MYSAIFILLCTFTVCIVLFQIGDASQGTGLEMARLSPGHQRPARTSYPTRSRSTGIPASTNNKPSIADKAANQQYLTPQEEQALVGYVLRLGDNGYPFPVKFLRSFAAVIVRQWSSIFQVWDINLTAPALVLLDLYLCPWESCVL